MRAPYSPPLGQASALASTTLCGSGARKHLVEELRGFVAPTSRQTVASRAAGGRRSGREGLDRRSSTSRTTWPTPSPPCGPTCAGQSCGHSSGAGRGHVHGTRSRMTTFGRPPCVSTSSRRFAADFRRCALFRHRSRLGCSCPCPSDRVVHRRSVLLPQLRCSRHLGRHHGSHRHQGRTRHGLLDRCDCYQHRRSPVGDRPGQADGWPQRPGSRRRSTPESSPPTTTPASAAGVVPPASNSRWSTSPVRSPGTTGFPMH